ncbi:MAG: BrnA antitoxin family protein [Paracoccaceae bacterium]
MSHDGPEDRPMTDAEWAAAPRVPTAQVAKLLGRPALPEDQKKRRVTMYLDRDVIARLKEGGRGWQTRANAKLREVLGL